MPSWMCKQVCMQVSSKCPSLSLSPARLHSCAQPLPRYVAAHHDSVARSQGAHLGPHLLHHPHHLVPLRVGGGRRAVFLPGRSRLSQRGLAWRRLTRMSPFFMPGRWPR